MDKQHKNNHKYIGAIRFIEMLTDEISQTGLFRRTFHKQVRVDEPLQETFQIRYKRKILTLKSWPLAYIEINAHPKINYYDLGIIITSPIRYSEPLEQIARNLLKEHSLTFDSAFILKGLGERMEEQILGQENFYLASRAVSEDLSILADVSEYEKI